MNEGSGGESEKFYFLGENATLNGVGLEEKFLSKLSTQGDIAFGSFLALASLLSALGNGSFLAVFYFRRGRLSPAEIFLVNLGIVDILLSLASYPFAMVSSFEHKWMFGQTGCTVYAFTCYFFGVASIVSLTAIAIIRYLKTCSPALGNRLSCQISFRIIIWVYIYSLFWACLPLTGFGTFDVEPFGLSCTLEWNGSGTLSQLHIILVSIFCVFLPIIVIIFCYSKIILLVQKSDHLVRDQRMRKQTSLVNDAQLTWISFGITLGFIVGWMPYCVVSLWGAFTGQVLIPIWATPIPVLMAKSSIAYNPLIYIFLTKRYREDLVKLVQVFSLCERDTSFASTVVRHGEMRALSQIQVQQDLISYIIPQEKRVKKNLNSSCGKSPTGSETSSNSSTTLKVGGGFGGGVGGGVGGGLTIDSKMLAQSLSSLGGGDKLEFEIVDESVGVGFGD